MTQMGLIAFNLAAVALVKGIFLLQRIGPFEVLTLPFEGIPILL